MARRPWNPGHGPRAFPTRKSRRRSDASVSPADHGPADVVQAVPDQVAVLNSPSSPTGRHDLHIVAVRRIRSGRIRGLLSPAAPNAPGPMAGSREFVLLRIRSAPTPAASGGRRIRDLSFADSGFAESSDLAAGRHRLQYRAAGVLQV